MRRAAVSIAANIAEGKGRAAQRDFARFLSIARGSLFELESHLIIAHRLQFVTSAELAPLLDQCQDVGRLLNGLLRRVRASPDLPARIAPYPQLTADGGG